VHALIFDFDGLILDTEASHYEAWRRTYQAHGQELPLPAWRAGVGRVGGFDALAELRARVGHPLDEPALRRERLRHRDEIIATLEVRPGVHAWLADAHRQGLHLAVASSSPRDWVVGHLERLSLLERFDFVATSDDVDHVKPHPAVYQHALAELGISGRQAVALEDSVHGATAAVQAGCFCVVVPNAVMQGQRFNEAHLVVGSLAECGLSEVLDRARAWRGDVEGEQRRPDFR